ncbi:MAG: hypothetical protein ACI4EF_01465 [Coprococcus sp.]
MKNKTYYYYTYSILTSSKNKKEYTYNFVAYTDMEDGNIYEIYGYSYNNEDVMNPDSYLEVMSITE